MKDEYLSASKFRSMESGQKTSPATYRVCMP
jgi:hypothetical protein